MGLTHELGKMFGGRPRLCPFGPCDHDSKRVSADERGGRPRRRPSERDSSTFCHECSQEVRGGRPRLCPAGRVFAEPPGNPVIKIRGSAKIKSCRPCSAESGSIDSFNKSGSNFEIDNVDCVPGTLELQTESIGVVDR